MLTSLQRVKMKEAASDFESVWQTRPVNTDLNLTEPQQEAKGPKVWVLTTMWNAVNTVRSACPGKKSNSAFLISIISDIY